MIREARESEKETLCKIWLESSITAHDFIDPSFWKAQKVLMKNHYLDLSYNEVLIENGRIVGFVSTIDNKIAALFIEQTQQNRSYGTRLLNHIKSSHNKIYLSVYEKNESAVKFYLKNGFTIISRQVDKQTNEIEYVMAYINAQLK